MKNAENNIDISSLAELCRLELSEKEAREMEKDMEKIAAFAKSLSFAPACERALEEERGSVPLREDEPCFDCRREEYLSAADSDDGYFSVVRVVE